MAVYRADECAAEPAMTAVCFAAGTLVLMADGSSKRLKRSSRMIWFWRIGERSRGTGQAAPCAEVFHNGSRPLLP